MKAIALGGLILFTAVFAYADLPASQTVEPSATKVSPATNALAVEPARLTLKVVKADSEETSGENGKAANAVDGNTNTIWHTQWQDDSPTCPHEIIIELSEAVGINGFTYLPRQDESDHGGIKAYEFYVSDDGKEFGTAVKTGEFTANKEKKTVTFDGKKCRFIKLRAVSEINGEPWTSAAEIGIVLAD